MKVTPKIAEYLLRFYPSLFEQARSKSDDALIGGSHGDYAGANRKGRGGHADPTAQRALGLLEANDLSANLALVRRWIEVEVTLEDRPLLLAVWRMRDWGFSP